MNSPRRPLFSAINIVFHSNHDLYNKMGYFNFEAVRLLNIKFKYRINISKMHKILLMKFQANIIHT